MLLQFEKHIYIPKGIDVEVNGNMYSNVTKIVCDVGSIETFDVIYNFMADILYNYGYRTPGGYISVSDKESIIKECDFVLDGNCTDSEILSEFTYDVLEDIKEDCASIKEIIMENMDNDLYLMLE